MTTQTNNVFLIDGLYCLWTEDGTQAARIDSGIISEADVHDLIAARSWARENLSGCETIDDMPTVARQMADAICDACGLHAELVAVCRVDD